MSSADYPIPPHIFYTFLLVLYKKTLFSFKKKDHVDEIQNDDEKMPHAFWSFLPQRKDSNNLHWINQLIAMTYGEQFE